MERDMSNGFILAHMVRQAGLVVEDDFEFINDSSDPEQMLQNFSVLNRACKKIGITITKKMVAEIISEQPGSAAALVMEIKKGIAKKGKPLSSTPAYKEALKSTRVNPKFVRQSDKYKSLSIDDKFIADAFNSLDITNFNAIDARCQQRHYEEFKHKVDARALVADDADEQMKRQVVQERKVKDIQALRDVKAAREAREEKLKENWKVTQKHKKDRQIRDLHFENAVYAIRELKTIRTNQLHDHEQSTGIDQFEQIMRRAGISQGDDDPTQLQSTYEEGEAFIRRLEETAQKKWPTNESVNDFLIHLKETTRANRQARHDKAIRKRRMLVEQQVAAAASAEKAQQAHDQETLLMTQKALLEQTAAAEEKLRVKQARIDEVQAKCLATTAKIQEDAELFLQIFSEQQRMQAAENDRDDDVQQVLLAQEKRKEEKHASAHVMCRSIVMDFIAMNSSFGFAELAEGASRMKKQFNGLNIDADLKFSETLLESCRQSLDDYTERHESVSSALPALGRRSPPSTAGTGSLRPPPPATAFDCIEADHWAMSVATVKNMGRWAHVPCSKSGSTSGSSAKDTYLRSRSFTENCHATLSTLLCRLIAEEEEAEARRPSVVMMPRQQGEGEGEGTDTESVMVPDPDAPVPPPVDAGFELIPLLRCTPTELQALQNNPNIAPSPNVNAEVGSSNANRRVILVCGSTDSGRYGGPCATPSEAQWGHIFEALGGESSVSCWDISTAMEVGKRLHTKVVEGKQPLNFPLLVELACKFSDSVICPPELLEIKLSPQAMKAAAELMDYCGRMFSLTQVVFAAGTNDIPLASLPFTDVSLCIVLGLTLWLRAYVQDVWTAILSPLEHPCPLAKTVVAGKLHSRVFALSQSVHVKIVQLILSGGSKDSVENDAELDAALQTEGAPKKPPAGDKPVPTKQTSILAPPVLTPSEEIIVRVELSTIFWLHMGSTTSIPEPLRAVTPVASPGEKAPPYAPSPREFAALLLQKFARAVDVKQATTSPTAAAAATTAADKSVVLSFPLAFNNYWKHPVPVCCFNTTCSTAVTGNNSDDNASSSSAASVVSATAAAVAGEEENPASAVPSGTDANTDTGSGAGTGTGKSTSVNRWLTLNTDSSLGVTHSLVAAVLSCCVGETAEAVSAIIAQSCAAALAAATPAELPELEEGQSPRPIVVTEDPTVMKAVLMDLWNGRLSSAIDDVSRSRILALETADKMWIMHKLGMRVLNAQSILECCETLQSCDALPLEWYSMLWSVLCSEVGFVANTMQRLICMFVNEIKQPDDRLRIVCLEFLEKLQQKLPSTNLAASPRRSGAPGGLPGGWGEGAGMLAASGAVTLPAMHSNVKKGSAMQTQTSGYNPKPPGAASITLSMTHRGKITTDSTLLTALPDQQRFLETGVSELLCTIGNMIDNKHKNCLTLSMHLQEELRACLNTVCSNIQADITPILIQACVCILNEKQKVAATLVRKLAECGYDFADKATEDDNSGASGQGVSSPPEEFPVAFTLLPTHAYTTASAQKFAIDKRRDELRGTIATMHSLFNQVAGSVEGPEASDVHQKTQEYEWTCWQRVLGSSFSSLERVDAETAGVDSSNGSTNNNNNNNNGQSSRETEAATKVYQELYLEALDVVDGFLRGIIAQVRHSDALTLATPKRVMGDAVHNCIRYQHAMLRKWSGELRTAFDMDLRTGRMVTAGGTTAQSAVANNANTGGVGGDNQSMISGNSEDGPHGGNRSLKSMGGSMRSFDSLPRGGIGSRRNSAAPALVLPAWYANGLRFLGRYYFGVSDSVLDDEVPWVSGQGMVDIQDYSLNPRQLLLLATEMNLVIGDMMRGRLERQERGHTVGQGQSATSPDALVYDSLMRCVQNLVNKQVPLTSAWSDHRRVRQLAAFFPQEPFPASPPVMADSAAMEESANVNAADASPGAPSNSSSRRGSKLPAPAEEEAVPQTLTGSDNKAATTLPAATTTTATAAAVTVAVDNTSIYLQVVRRFFQKLLMTLILGLTPVAPSVEYISTVCRAAISSPASANPSSLLAFSPLALEEQSLSMREDATGALPVESFVTIMTKNDKVAKGWWRDASKLSTNDYYRQQGQGQGHGKTTASVTMQALRLTTGTATGPGTSINGGGSSSPGTPSVRDSKISTGRVNSLRSSSCRIENANTVPLSPSADAVTLLHAIALVCTDIRQRVIAEELLLVMCMTPVGVAGAGAGAGAPGCGWDNLLLNSSGLCTDTGTEDAEAAAATDAIATAKNGAVPGAVSNSQFYAVFNNRSLFKLAVLAQKLVVPMPSTQEDAVAIAPSDEEVVSFAATDDNVLPPARLMKFNGGGATALTLNQCQWLVTMLRKHEVDVRAMYTAATCGGGAAPGSLYIKRVLAGDQIQRQGHGQEQAQAQVSTAARISVDSTAPVRINITDVMQLIGNGHDGTLSLNNNTSSSTDVERLLGCRQLQLDRALALPPLPSPL